MTILVHTADWHLGKSFHRFAGDVDTQGALRASRFAALEQLGAAARDLDAAAVLVAGDLFHSHDVDDKTLVLALAAIGRIGLPVVAIPGNHDHGGAGSLWERRVFANQQPVLAPNLTIVREATTAIAVGEVDVIACPVRQRMQQLAVAELGSVATAPGRPRIGLLHGATDAFGEPDSGGRALQLDGDAAARLDYLALGDYHRQQPVTGLHCPASYAGTHEPDGFPSHGQDGERVGGCLRIDVLGPGRVQIAPLPLAGGKRWTRLTRRLQAAADVELLLAELHGLLQHGVQTALCQLVLDGSQLDFATAQRLQTALDDLRPRFLVLESTGDIAIAPSPAEMQALRHLPGLAGAAAARLLEQLATDASGATEHALARLYRLLPEGTP